MPRIRVGEAAIACRESGRGAPVVLLHSSASSGQWRALAERLEGRFRVLAPDLHGHGGSDPWPGPAAPTLDDEAAIVVLVLAEVNLGRITGGVFGPQTFFFPSRVVGDEL